MTASLRVLAPGLLTTVQDLGRPGYQSLDIPVSGALDPISLRAANALVGNAPGTGALEVAYVGPTLMVEADEVLLAFVGAQATIEIRSDIEAGSGRRIATMRSVRPRRGHAGQAGSPPGGPVLSLAGAGGVRFQPVVGS